MPTYEDILLPLLKLTQDGHEHRVRDLADTLASQFLLTEEERAELLSSGQPRFENRIGWARSALKQAGLIESPRRAYVCITNRGREVLASGVAAISDKYLMRFPEYLAYKGIGGNGNAGTNGITHLPITSTPAAVATPQERLEEAYADIQKTFADDILAKAKECSPAFFERLVVELLVKMGYGGSLHDAAGSITGRSGDGGIDGIIKEDELGLDMIYLQAKRYTTANVPIGEVRDFVGALVGKRARKGVFITTSGFQEEARRYAQTIEGKTLVLIDGVMLAKLMLKHELGFSVTDTYKIGRIDEDYFEQGTSL